MLLLRISQTLHKFSVPYALVGGYAVSLHGAVRGTLDIDLIIRWRERDFINVEKALNSIGLKSRLPVSAQEIFKFREEYIKNRNLVAWSFVNSNNPIELVDIIITHDLSKVETIDISIGSDKISVISLNDLIKMKSRVKRPQDIEDIKALKKLQ